MSIKRMLIFTIFFFLSTSVGMAQEKIDSKDQIIQWLNLYVDLDEENRVPDIFFQLKIIKDKGIDPIQFSKGLISDIQYADFWNDSLGIYTASLYQENKMSEMSAQLIEWIERKEPLYPCNVIMFKTMCMNTLIQMVGPNFFQDPVLKEKIISFANRLCTEEKMVDPAYWHRAYGIEKYISIPKESQSQEIIDTIMWADTMARCIVEFAGNLYYATSDDRYLKVLDSGKNSSYGQIQGMANSFLTQTLKSQWAAGEYELYASRKQYQFSPEEIERMKQNTGNMRSIKDKNQPQQ